MNKKNKLEQRMKLSKEEWEKEMLEESSYYDIDILNQANAKILEKIKYWEEYKASSNMGKWWASIQIEKLKKRLKGYERKD